MYDGTYVTSAWLTVARVAKSRPTQRDPFAPVALVNEEARDAVVGQAVEASRRCHARLMPQPFRRVAPMVAADRGGYLRC